MKRILFFALLLTLTVSVLFGCDSKGAANAGEGDFDFDGSLASYTIVYGEDDKDSHKAAKNLQSGLAALGVNIPYQGDIEIPEIEYQLRTDFEIVIGKTSRDEELGALADEFIAANDYLITFADARIFIRGGSEEANINAVEFFLSDLMDGSVCTFKENVRYEAEYRSFIVCGGEIDAICASESTEKLAKSVQYELQRLVGREIPITEEKADSGVIYFDLDFDKYIDSYHIKAEGGNLCLGAPTQDGLKAAAERLCEMIKGSATDIKLENGADESKLYVKNAEEYADYKENLQLTGTTEKDSLSYKLNEDIPFKVFLRYGSDETVGCKQFNYTVMADGAEQYSGSASGRVGELRVTIPAGYIKESGSVRIKVEAIGENDEVLVKFIGGAIVNMEEISSLEAKPDDFEAFWKENLQEIFAVEPNDTTAPTGDKHYSNYFHYYKIDEEYARNSINCESMIPYLEDYDVYEVFLKTSREMPAVCYITIPKNPKNESYPILMTLNHYDARNAIFSKNENMIAIGVGPCGMPGVYYDEKTNTYTAAPYGGMMGFADRAGDYENPQRAYFVGMLQRNVQVLRFLSNPEYTKGTPFEAVTALYNGEINFNGGSMGGFQVMATAALVALSADIGEEIGEVAKIEARCPWMCDPITLWRGGDRIKSDSVASRVNSPSKGLAYFDTAHFASIVECEELLIIGGFADTTCPSTGIIAAYNSAKCNTVLDMTQNRDHSGENPKTIIKYTRTK